jgi:DNA-binding transcriptional ArsR family regulator
MLVAVPVTPPEPAGRADGDRSAIYRTLTNPLRRLILSHLQQHREANSTSLARALGESTGTTSYHLRKLAEQGFVEEIPEKSGGRERWWRALPFHIQAPDPAKMAAAEWSAAIQHTRVQAEHDIDLYFRVLTQYEGPDGWAQLSRGGFYMTREELLAFYKEHLALQWKYGQSAHDAPQGARPVAVRFFAVPEDAALDPDGGELRLLEEQERPARLIQDPSRTVLRLPGGGRYHGHRGQRREPLERPRTGNDTYRTRTSDTAATASDPKCSHQVLLAPPDEAEVAPPGQFQLLSAHRAGTRTSCNPLVKALLVAAKDRSWWGQNAFANDLGGAGRTWNGGAETSSQSQIRSGPHVPDHRTTPVHMAQVPDVEMLTAVMCQELSSGPIDDIDGEPLRAQNTAICTGTWPLDLDPQTARNGGSARVLSSLLITVGVVDAAKRRDFIDVIARMFTSSGGTYSSQKRKFRPSAGDA